MSKQTTLNTISNFVQSQHSQREKTSYEKLLDKLFEGKELSKTQKKAWGRYKTVIDLRNNGYSKQKVIQLLIKKEDISEASAYKIINEAEKVLAKVSVTDKEAERIIYANRLDEIARICIDKALGNIEINVDDIEGFEDEVNNKGNTEIKDFSMLMTLAKDCIKEAAKIKGLSDEKNQAPILQLPVIHITSNPEQAREQLRINA